MVECCQKITGGSVLIMTARQTFLVNYLKSLRDNIMNTFESLETTCTFQRKNWDHVSGGGGEISLLQGECFEKGAVNWSGVRGNKLPLQEGETPFFATGVSLITHMKNPHAPTVHMNVRYIETPEKWWFGGGYDLTPMGFFYDEDTRHFHDAAKNSLDPHGADLYPSFAKNAEEYFFIPHRKKQRGVGGIFFDYYNTGDFDKDLKMWQSVGDSFLSTIMPIYERRAMQPYTEDDKEEQQRLRAHYAEFNLLYDRGTKFGFVSGGNPEAILCSMPPCAKW